MGRKFFHVEHFSALRFKYAHGREQRKIGEVLVVDRVEFVPFNQLQQMRELKGQNSLGASTGS